VPRGTCAARRQRRWGTGRSGARILRSRGADITVGVGPVVCSGGVAEGNIRLTMGWGLGLKLLQADSQSIVYPSSIFLILLRQFHFLTVFIEEVDF